MKRAALSAAALLCACSLGPQSKTPVAVYDFGIAGAALPGTRIAASLRVPDVAAPVWLDTPAIIYRLAYRDAARREAYSLSRWAGAPAALLTQRLRTRLAGVTDGGVLAVSEGAMSAYSVSVDLEDFSQVFDAPESSRVVVRARATLISNAKRTLIAQKSFSIERAAPSANAQGGVRALSQASDELIGQVIVWVAQNAPVK